MPSSGALNVYGCALHTIDHTPACLFFLLSFPVLAVGQRAMTLAYQLTHVDAGEPLFSVRSRSKGFISCS
jgi:hypothetical protein